MSKSSAVFVFLCERRREISCGGFAISYTFFPQCCFIACLLGGQRMRVQPTFTDALFMLMACFRPMILIAHAAWSQIKHLSK